MMDIEELLNEGPEVRQRARGGFIALSRRSWPMRIGVTADDETSARSEFERVVSLWWRAYENDLAKQSLNQGFCR